MLKAELFGFYKTVLLIYNYHYYLEEKTSTQTYGQSKFLSKAKQRSNRFVGVTKQGCTTTADSTEDRCLIITSGDNNRSHWA